ncbi:MAG: DNA photolyase [Thermoanaerobaculia bacterium]|nr:DNA photolyase [Thermoanaerobaculia bacterium]
MKISAVYVEDEVREHPRTRAILARLHKIPHISCTSWSEVFNRRSQNFRLQKRRPGLILAWKRDGYVLPTPEGYGISRGAAGDSNHYFSHLLNCPYDCRYCFLQGMYRSAHYVLFVNYERFFDAVESTVGRTGPGWFFSGYDADSLALERLTGFASDALTAFRQIEGAHLELRTKSTQIGSLLEVEPFDRAVVAWSFTPDSVSGAVEHGVPSVTRRINALRRVAERGWSIGLRFDPVLACDDFENAYRDLFDQILDAIPDERLHSVSLGPFRLPTAFFRRLEKLHPDDPLVAGGPWQARDGMVSYPPELEQRWVGFVLDELRRRIGEDRLFPCGVTAATGPTSSPIPEMELQSQSSV